MTLRQFSNSVRIVWSLSGDEYLACINAEDRQFIGDPMLLDRFRRDPLRAFVSLPDQDQVRLFAIIERKNKEAGL